MKKAKGLFSSPSLTVRCAFDMCSSAVVPPKPCDADVLRNKVHSLRWESGGKARVRFFFFTHDARYKSRSRKCAGALI